MQQTEPQRIPVTIYRGEARLTVAAPLPGMEPEDITVELHGDGRLVLHAKLRGALKGDKEVLDEEWTAGPYHRKLALPDAVNGELANVTYNNGVLVVALPLAEVTTPACLTLTAVGPAHGERIGSHGHPVRPTTAEEHHAGRQ